MVVFFGGTSGLRVLAGLVLAPFVLAGSLFVLGFVFFSWLEQRAIDAVSGRGHRHWRAQVPVIPWLLVAIFVGAPFLAVALLSLKIAAFLLFIAAVTPVAYWHLDK
jgi:hypothetical protein